MLKRTVLALVLVVTALPAQEPQPRNGAGALNAREKAIHALARLGYGPRPGEVDRVQKIGAEKWIANQLAPGKIADALCEGIVKEYEAIRLNPKQAEARIAKGGNRGRATAKVRQELLMAIVMRSRYSERQLVEVLADFWRNHFNIDLDKSPVVQACAPHYEEAVIRRHVLGDFERFLMDTARHPAMLVYLDNFLSRRPPTKAELNAIKSRTRLRTKSKERAEQSVAIAQQRGLNENYARELMELHTLGVDNGYTQKDVVEVARALTGWTVDKNVGDTFFVYREDMHDKGRKRLMGKDLPMGRRESGIVEGEAVIHRLAKHKNTSHFIAWKLCRRFVSDRPSDAIVEHVAKAFRRSKGNLRDTTRAMLEHPEFWSRRNYLAKFKTPLEFVLSAIRATGAEIENPLTVVLQSRLLGLDLYRCEDPTGYSDAASEWRDPGVMALRWRFALSLAHGRIKGIKVPAKLYQGLPDDLLELPDAIAKRIVPQGIGPGTRQVLERVLFRETQRAGSLERLDRKKLSQTFVGILIGSPEFQQQ